MKEIPSINKYMPIAVLYFFFNSLFLPHGLLYTTLLTPFFLYLVIKQGGIKETGLFFILLLPFIFIHYANGIEVKYYSISTLLLFSTFIFCYAFYFFLKKCNSLRLIFKDIMILNFVLTAIAIITYPIAFFRNILWLTTEITAGFSGVKRLQLFTYEPSYYSMLLAPIALYYYIKIIARNISQPAIAFILVSVPLLLSLSFGVISAILMALMFVVLPNLKGFFPKFANPVVFIFLSGFILIILAIVAHFFPDNLLFARINNVLSGTDTSFLGRTYDSFYLGWEIASEKNIWFGCGPGQTKLIGLDNYRAFYNHEAFTSADVKIPNSLGDTLATFGVVGLAARLIAVSVLFFKTNVYNNYYRLGLFAFIFIYQFTGSFITNIAEYVIWIMAFYPGLFPEFDRTNLNEYLDRSRSVSAQ